MTYADGTYDEYEYNTNDTIKRVTGSNPTVSYTYDTLHRLTKEVNLALGKTFDYTYDKNGNILSKTTDGVATNYQYDTTVKDRLVAVGNQSIEYDAVGNPIYYLSNSLGWTRGRLLSSFGNNFYTYNSAGIRTSKTVGISTTNYGLVGSTIVSEQTGNTKHYYYHSANGVVGFSRRVGDTTTDYYYRKNLQGDVVALLNASGNVVAKYVYDAWGNHRIYDSANTIIYESDNSSAYTANANHIACLNPFRYRGYYFDTETGLYYLQSRYYDPTTGRFLNPDTVDYLDPQSVTGINLYAYCANNPVMYADPTGHFLIFVTRVVIGAVVGAAVALITSGGGEYLWKEVLVGAVVGALTTGLGIGVSGISGVGGVIFKGALNFSMGVMGNLASQRFVDGKKPNQYDEYAASFAGFSNIILGGFNNFTDDIVASGPSKESSKIFREGVNSFIWNYLKTEFEKIAKPVSYGTRIRV